MTDIHITADSDCWTGASTLAVLAAKQSQRAVVITAGNSDMVRRIEAAGVCTIQCPMGKVFGALNLSRVLRHIEGDEFNVYVHSPNARKLVENALKLVGRTEPFNFISENPEPEFPMVEVERPKAEESPLLMWLGNITDDCGLLELINALGTKVDKTWRLRIVGQGKAKIVSPILKRAKFLGINNRIEWIGYSDNPYKQMNGVSAAIVRNPQSVAAREFAAASIPTYTNLSDIL